MSEVVRAPGAHSLNHPFGQVFHSASFLFGRDIVQYLDLAWEKAATLRAIARRYEAHASLPEDTQTELEINVWFGEQVQGELRRRFALYLDLSTWK